MTGAGGRQRLDKWLFFARAVKSRTLAQKFIESGVVRVNAIRTDASDHKVGAGDVLTFALGTRIVVWRVLDPGQRRGPASEAALLYEDLSPPPPPKAPPNPLFAQRDPGTGRPTKRERREVDRLMGDGEDFD